jgi:hypothetical protein
MVRVGVGVACGLLADDHPRPQGGKSHPVSDGIRIGDIILSLSKKSGGISAQKPGK